MSVVSAISAAGERWSPWSGGEQLEAWRACSSHADNFEQAAQAFLAYLFIASKRDNETMRAGVSDKEACAYVPNRKGALHMSEATFRQTVKPRLEAWGLLRCEAGAATASGRAPTLYSFPLLELIAGREPSVVATNESHGCSISDSHEGEPRMGQGPATEAIRDRHEREPRSHPQPAHGGITEPSVIATNENHAIYKREYKSGSEKTAVKEEPAKSTSLVGSGGNGGRAYPSSPAPYGWEQVNERCPMCGSEHVEKSETPRGTVYRCETCAYERPARDWYGGGAWM